MGLSIPLPCPGTSSPRQALASAVCCCINWRPSSRSIFKGRERSQIGIILFSELRTIYNIRGYERGTVVSRGAAGGTGTEATEHNRTHRWMHTSASQQHDSAGRVEGRTVSPQTAVEQLDGHGQKACEP